MLLHKELLQNKKNLLAFSAGVDSTALLFLLLENKIPFDVAIVDYGLREESKDEVSYAKELALKYNFNCYVYTAPEVQTNFEANARKIRYDFFEELIQKHQYDNLLTAHHLGDRFEWMLMQFCKGAGCVELSGMQVVDKRSTYTLVRPLLHLDKQELLVYLHDNQIKYFEDSSNNDESYKRNEFRHNYAKPLLEKYLPGIKKSFEYIDEDITELVSPPATLSKCDELIYF
ncbi:tRNA lysidine(34) synthetase TilS, partial [Sulfurimonas sp. SAG-AH-194-C20]